MSMTDTMGPGDPRRIQTPAHDKEMAGRFLAGLDPNATRFTFQLFSDCGAGARKFSKARWTSVAEGAGAEHAATGRRRLRHHQ